MYPPAVLDSAAGEVYGAAYTHVFDRVGDLIDLYQGDTSDVPKAELTATPKPTKLPKSSRGSSASPKSTPRLTLRLPKAKPSKKKAARPRGRTAREHPYARKRREIQRTQRRGASFNQAPERLMPVA